MTMIGETPLSYAVVNGIVNTVRYLLDHGANPDNVDKTGFTPLHEAAKKGYSLKSLSFSRSLSWLLL
jgi:ankyrin repeat protein